MKLSGIKAGGRGTAGNHGIPVRFRCGPRAALGDLRPRGAGCARDTCGTSGGRAFGDIAPGGVRHSDTWHSGTWHSGTYGAGSDPRISRLPKIAVCRESEGDRCFRARAEADHASAVEVRGIAFTMPETCEPPRPAAPGRAVRAESNS
ncbi:hypothetical protein GCM10012285_42060 [Streptomyces kronopolitis]|uniref:Uncharacterized protein n=1 Tax=Streptomyces kronopolitis TaxID=1612435 RepID=A0ABQ2JQ65_9ACTN|nr:hypothetical protein GCM10012285_42060 [Streptomyces kronopolitis]